MGEMLITHQFLPRLAFGAPPVWASMRMWVPDSLPYQS